MRNKATAEHARESVGQVVTWCFLIAVRGVLGFGTVRMDRFSAQAGKMAALYQNKCAAQGAQADKWLQKQVEGLTFVLPCDKPPKNRRAKDELMQKRLAADVAWRLLAATLRHPAPAGVGVSAAKVQQVLEETRLEYLRFLDWAREGDAYGYERLRADVALALGEELQVQDDGSAPVFSRRIF